MSYRKFAFPLFLIAILLMTTAICEAQDARIRVRVEPIESYVFLDGKAMGHGVQELTMAPGKHIVSVYNYGFTPQVSEITVTPGMKESITAYLEPVGGEVSGPWGAIQVEGPRNAAVLLNGKTPEFFVGHPDALNNHIWWKQQLVVPPATHEVTVMEGENVIWSGPVTVKPNERVILYADQEGRQVVKAWAEGSHLKMLPRFKAGAASATIAIAPVSGTFTTEPALINCNDRARLSWKTEDALHAYLTSDPAGIDEEVSLIGERDVHPKVDTMYTLRAVGPGGAVTKNVLVRVNPVVQALMTASSEPAHYIRIGDKMLNEDTATFKYFVDNADEILLDELGIVPAVPAKLTVGEQTFKPVPKETTAGPIDEKQIYQLTATNVCGGSTTTTAELHVVGMVEPAVSSVFFPTAYPKSEHPSIGLLASQQEQLIRVADAFKLYMEHTPDAKLLLVGNADPRASKAGNMALSRRRAERVQAFLITQGIPKDKMEIHAMGSKKAMDRKTVLSLEAQNGASGKRAKNVTTAKLAYDRRVDIVVLPAAMESAKHYPHATSDSALMWNRVAPSYRAVEKNQ